MGASWHRTAAWATAMQLAFFASGVAAALAAQRAFRILELPDVKVVRKVDYNHYPAERWAMILEFCFLFVAYRVGGYGKQVPTARTELIAVLLSGWLQVFIMEVGLQTLGSRKMDLVAFSERAPFFVVSVLDALDRVGAPLLVRKVFAVLWQTFLEGALYFGRFFLMGLMVRAGRPTVPLCFTAYSSLFRIGISLAYGWPQPIVYGSDAEGKRLMLSTLPYRIPQVACLGLVLREPRWRAVWWPLPLLQSLGLGIYFFMLRYMGRSYLELVRPGVDGATALPLAADLGLTLFRVFEPLTGAVTAVYVACRALERVAGAEAKQKELKAD